MWSDFEWAGAAIKVITTADLSPYELRRHQRGTPRLSFSSAAPDHLRVQFAGGDHLAARQRFAQYGGSESVPLSRSGESIHEESGLARRPRDAARDQASAGIATFLLDYSAERHPGRQQ